MATYNSYYPLGKAAQIPWLRNFHDKISPIALARGFSATEIDPHKAGILRLIYLLESVAAYARSYAVGITSHINQVSGGPDTGAVLELPLYALPAVPTPPPAVPGGVLKRLFPFIIALRNATGFTEAEAETLQIVGSSEPAGTKPLGSLEAQIGHVDVKFNKDGHLGVVVEGKRGAGDWEMLGIDLHSPYNDTRPLLVPGQAEKRFYRLRFWNGEPEGDYSDILETLYGG